MECVTENTRRPQYTTFLHIAVSTKHFSTLSNQNLMDRKIYKKASNENNYTVQLHIKLNSKWARRSHSSTSVFTQKITPANKFFEDGQQTAQSSFKTGDSVELVYGM